MADIKDLFYLGLGSALIAKEKIEEEIKELAEKGKITREQQAEFLAKAKKKAKEEEKEFSEKFKNVVKDALSEMGLATKEDIEELKKMINDK
ncbi:hypothetical protein [Seleniivibrio woodruffii]|uniref:Polyhydroxyalkanoate synthesis regulator phasin n=1 Tax=Seleniivibrio woodruffii TaxID=1078050 RepID=A0A4R1K8E5_9BACT|nr:hypothetical protein [Seleniivibrio woodruffii]TCK60596.1 polyhydroxyalkanoate synthesis regulator phasin [Seleniivibrio woodruffii]TVZ36225.1 polyhydroxyalkanoate synthesis regulator phasin [Seleniivibrio woodruffii]